MFTYKIKFVMRKYALTLLLLFFVAASQAQKSLSAGIAGNFSFGVKGFGVNDAAFGATLHGSWRTSRLGLRIETGVDKFIGDKLLFIDSVGNHYGRNPALKNVKLGPEFYITQNVLLTALYGRYWYTLVDKNRAQDGIKFALHLHPHKGGRFFAGLQFTKLFGSATPVQFYGLSAGVRVF